jgi:hypothetical protein
MDPRHQTGPARLHPAGPVCDELRTQEASELNLYKACPFEPILRKQSTFTRIEPFFTGNRERITVVNNANIPAPTELRDTPLRRIPRFHPPHDRPLLSNKPKVAEPADLNRQIRLERTSLRRTFEGFHTRTEEIAEHDALAINPGHHTMRVSVITKRYREDIPWRIRQLSSHL